MNAGTTFDALVRPGARVGFVHAHPDDETLATGVVIAQLAEHGAVPLLLTATRGEAGEIVPGTLTCAPGSPELASARERELAAARDVLRVAEHAFLGTPPARAGAGERHYRDSGMVWITSTLAGPADGTDDRSLTAASRDEAAADLTAWVAAVRPDALVTYDDIGGYGHPDHIRLRELTCAVGAHMGLPVFEVLTAPEPAADASAPEHAQGSPVPVPIDRPDLLPVVLAALRCYPSQLTVTAHTAGEGWIEHVGGQRERVLTAVALRRVA